MANPYLLADNRFLEGTPVVTDTASGYDALNIRDLKTFTKWQAASSGEKYITVDCGESGMADTLALCGHNLAGAAVSVESSMNRSAWIERLAPFYPKDNKAKLKGFALAAGRYWRVKIVSGEVVPSIAEVMLGKRIEFPSPPVTPHVPESLGLEASIKKGRTGTLLGSIVKFKPYEITPYWERPSRAWTEQIYLPVFDSHISELKPFFFAWDVDAYPEDVRFVTLDPDAKIEMPVSVMPWYDSLSLPMVGVKE